MRGGHIHGFQIGIPPGLGLLLDRLKAGASLPEALGFVAATGQPAADALAAWSEFIRLMDGEAERPPEIDPPPTPLAPRAVWLHITDRCNLSCRYCIDDRHSRAGDMSEQTMHVALDRLFDRAPQQGAVSINFFGGEPTLNLPLIRQAVKHARRRACRDGRDVQFEMVTNGTLLDDSFADFLEEHRFRVTVSLDGPAGLHDPLRPFASGRGSHQAATAGALRLLSRPAIQVKVRATITRTGLPLAPVLDYFLSLGIRDIEMLPVASPPDGPLALSGEHWKNYATELGELSLRWVKGLACGMRRFSLWPFAAYLPRIHARRIPETRLLPRLLGSRLLPHTVRTGARNRRSGRRILSPAARPCAALPALLRAPGPLPGFDGPIPGQAGPGANNRKRSVNFHRRNQKMKHLFDMDGHRYEVPDEIAASSVRPVTSSLLFDSKGKLYEAAPHDLSKYRVAGVETGGRLAVLNPAASTTGEEIKGKQRLCGPIVTWCDRGFCLK